MPKPDNKELNTPTSGEQKEDAYSDERVKENIKVVNDGDQESLCPLFFIKFLFFHQMIDLQKL